MKSYEAFARTLDNLLAGETAIRITVPGYMALSIEAVGRSAEGGELIAISHVSVQNGDLMRDPEIVFEVREAGPIRAAEPISFRNDFVGVHQEVYRCDDSGRRTHVVPRLRTELRAFARTWFRNLREQGFLGRGARRESIA